MSPPLVRTWSGHVVQLTKANFWRWLQGWVRWTIRLRPTVPSHLDQSEEVTDPSWPQPVRPWRGPERLSKRQREEIRQDEEEFFNNRNRREG